MLSQPNALKKASIEFDSSTAKILSCNVKNPHRH